MTTALDIITRAYRTIGEVASGETLDSALANDGLVMLNDLLETWSIEHLMVYNNAEIIQTLTPNQYVYTIGPTGDIPAVRPLRIDACFVRNGNLDYPVGLISVDQYAQIGLKSLNGPWPTALFYNADQPNGTLNFWPNPSTPVELHLITDAVLSSFPSLTTAVNLPAGYVRALRFNLAQEMLSEFGRSITPELRGLAAESKAAVKRLNMDPQTPAQYDAALASARQHDAGWILHGGFA